MHLCAQIYIYAAHLFLYACMHFFKVTHYLNQKLLHRLNVRDHVTT